MFLTVDFKINDKWIIKSGSDFKELSVIEMVVDAESNKSQVNSILKYTIDSKIEEHLPTKLLINEYMGLFFTLSIKPL